ncbi:MAG: hypothetical protein IJ148_01510 [Bacteroidaceae bacterium]|nr:hypothetical protein [Bacteroidaceae bacterium]
MDEDTNLSNTHERLTDDRLQQYMHNRFGQRSDTRARYAEAIVACGSILYLDKTIAEIARLFGHQEECLRNQLKRHFPELVAERERIRGLLNMSKLPARGVGKATVEKYKAAIELLRTSNITIREAAEQTGVSLAGLHQHLLFFHKDIVEQRFLRRLNALGQPKVEGETNGTGRINEPRKATKALYADAIELYRTTDRPVTEIAMELGLDPHNLSGYIQRWHREDMAVRAKKRSEKTEQRREKRKLQQEMALKKKAENKYIPAIQLIENGASYADAAKAIGISPERLTRWTRRHRPDVHKQAMQNAWITLPGGMRIMRQKWLKMQEAEKAFLGTDESIIEIARRLKLSPTSLLTYLHAMHREDVQRRRDMKGKH